MTPVEIAPWVLETAAGAASVVFGGLTAAVKILWDKVERLETAHAVERAIWHDRWSQEVRRGVTLYNAPTGPIPSVPPAPEEEPTGVRRLRAKIVDQAVDEELSRYLRSRRDPH